MPVAERLSDNKLSTRSQGVLYRELVYKASRGFANSMAAVMHESCLRVEKARSQSVQHRQVTATNLVSPAQHAVQLRGQSRHRPVLAKAIAYPDVRPVEVDQAVIHVGPRPVPFVLPLRKEGVVAVPTAPVLTSPDSPNSTHPPLHEDDVVTVPTIPVSMSPVSAHSTPKARVGNSAAARDFPRARSRNYVRQVVVTEGRIRKGTIATTLAQQLQEADFSKVVCTTESHLFHTLLSLVSARKMLEKSDRRMPVFQPTILAKDAPDTPAGSLALHLSKLESGMIMTNNSLIVGNTKFPEDFHKSFAKAVVARMYQYGHTVIEGYGPDACVQILKAIAQARRSLLIRYRDVSVSLTAEEVNIRRKGTPEKDLQRPLKLTFTLLECEPRQPSKVKAFMEVKTLDRASGVSS